MLLYITETNPRRQNSHVSFHLADNAEASQSVMGKAKRIMGN